MMCGSLLRSILRHIFSLEKSQICVIGWIDGRASGDMDARSLSPSAWRSTEHVAVNHGPDAPYVVSLHRLFRDDRENTDDDFAAARAAALGAIR